MRYIPIFLCTLAFLGSAAAAQPNIVIIYADDMGYGDLSIQNPDSKLTTPHLDQLAREGIRFIDGHSSSGVCSPSRYALLTGNYHWRRNHSIVGSFGGPYFEPDELTLARMLQQRGYATAAIGKWHLGWDWQAIRNEDVPPIETNGKPEYLSGSFDWSKPIPGGPLDQGFDYYFGDGTINFPPYTWIENDRVLEVPAERVDLGDKTTKVGPWGLRPGPMVAGWQPYDVLPTLTKKAVAYIGQQKKSAPFFLYFALPSPHVPVIPNDEFDGKSQAGAYGDFVYQTDWAAGEVLKALDERGLSDSTLVIFSSDNGPEKFAYDRIRDYGHFSMGSLRGLKRDTWEGGHRVPFIVRWPEQIEAGRVSDEVISQVDIMATVAALADYDLPDDAAVDSYNFLPVWCGDKFKSPVREATVQNTRKDRYAIRQGKWVLIDEPSGEISPAPDWYYEQSGYPKPNEKTHHLLFDLDRDLGQKVDLANENPEVVARLQNLLRRYRSEGRSVGR